MRMSKYPQCLKLLILMLFAISSLCGCHQNQVANPKDGLQKVITLSTQTNLLSSKFFDADSQAVSMVDLVANGKPSFIMVWASWCPRCKEQLPIVDNLYKTYGDKINFVLLNAVDNSRETVEQGKAYLLEKNYSFPYYADIDMIASKGMQVTQIPTMYLLNGEGEISYAYDVNQSQDQLISYLEDLLKLK